MEHKHERVNYFEIDGQLYRQVQVTRGRSYIEKVAKRG